MTRRLFTALAAGLLLTAATPGLAPAQAQMGSFTHVGMALLRVENVSLDRTGDQVRYVLRIALTNKGPQPIAAATLMQVRAHPGSDFNQGVSLIPTREGTPRGGDIVLGPNESATLFYVLPDDPARPSLTVLAIDEQGAMRPAFTSSIEDLRAGVSVLLDTEQLDAFAGRYRTSLGTVVTLRRDGARLIGSSQTVGAKPDYSQTYELTPRDKYSLTAVLRQPRGEPWGEASLYAHNNRPLYGKFTTGPQAERTFSACPIPEAEANSWTDPMLRVGSSAWARLESVAATRLENGKLRIEATVRAWNVSAGERGFQLGVGKGFEMQTAMLRAGGDPYDWRLKRCQGETMSFVSEGRYDDVTTLLFEGGLNGRAYADPWDIASVIAKAAPAADGGEDEPASTPAPPPSAPTGGGDTGEPSTPTWERPDDGGVPAALRTYSNYGIWDFRIERFETAPDGDMHAIVRVRDAAIYRVGLTTGGVRMTIFDEDGRSLASDDTLYRATPQGRADRYEPIPQTMWMEKGDEIRVRLIVRRSKGFRIVRIRMGSGDRETLSRTFPVLYGQ